jgi:phosphatidyl-myo-inositol dimannoside synthase
VNVFFLGYGISPSVGGIDRYSNTLLEYLQREGHQIGVYTYRPLTADSIGLPRDVVLRRWRGIDRIAQFHRLRWFLRRMQCESILCQHLYLSPLANRLAATLDISFDLLTFGVECWGGRFRRRAAQLHRLRRCTSPSAFTSQQLVEQGFPRERIVHLPPVVDLAAFVPKQAQSNPARFVILTVARLAPDEQYKGHDVIIRALPRILAAVPGAVYKIAGRGEDRERLEQLAAEAGVAGAVSFLGFVPDGDLARVYAEADVFAMPSRVSLSSENPQGEGFGLAFIEASAMGKPLVGPNEGGSTELIEDGYNGFNVDPRSPEALADAIIRLAQDPEMRVAMGRNARQRVAERYTTAQLPRYVSPLFKMAETRM